MSKEQQIPQSSYQGVDIFKGKDQSRAIEFLESHGLIDAIAHNMIAQNRLKGMMRDMFNIGGSLGVPQDYLFSLARARSEKMEDEEKKGR